ncbi:MAG TPA: hypothetical protein VHG89_01050 [Verrucomicrobiae bacterium]|nr:hypothetical protein [Verrucomicrobiae bacterium]
MKLIILDHFRRRWFLWTAFCLLNLTLGLFLNNAEPALFPIFIAFPLIIGPNLWFQEIQAGYPRVLLGLPLGALEIGRTLWFLSVGIASLIASSFSLVGLIIAKCFWAAHLGFYNWLLFSFVSLFMFGGMFGLLTCLTNPIKKVGRPIYGILTWVCFMAVFYFIASNYSPLIKLTLFFLISGTLTILGWIRVESLIVDYGEHRAASQASSPRQFKVPIGFGGIGFLLATAFIQIWSFGFYFLIITSLLTFFTKHTFDWHHLTHNLGSYVPFFFIFFGGYSFLSGGLNLRLFRAMPLSPNKIAATFPSVYILPLLTLFLAFTLLAWKETGSFECVSWIKVELLGIAPACFFIAVAIWNPTLNFIKTFFVVVFVISTFIPAFYQFANMNETGLPFWFIAIFDLILVTFYFWIMSKIISQSSSAYRPRQNQIGNRWNWGR